MEEKNSIIFKTSSVLGETITLTQEYFEKHIVAHHPEMKGHENDIKDTIEEPNLVYKAKRFPEKRKHFVRKTNKSEPSNYNNVIVEYTEENEGHIKTSYYSENLGVGGGENVYLKFENKL